MSSVSCVFCGRTASQFMEKRGIAILHCSGCEHLFADLSLAHDHVENVYGSDYFFGGKDGYPNYLDEAPLLEQRGRRYARLLRRYTEPGEQLDVGAAAGFILKGFEAGGWSGTGLEPNAEMVQFGNEKLGLELIRGTLETCNLKRQFDLVSLIQVVAHLNDLPTAFTKLRSLTRDGGLLLVETWNQKSLTARLLGKYWHEYSPPSVLHWFTPDRLADVLRQYGFERVAQGRTLKWISLRHAVSLSSFVLGDGVSKRLQEKIPTSLRVPYPSEDLFWGIYRAV